MWDNSHKFIQEKVTKDSWKFMVQPIIQLGSNGALEVYTYTISKEVLGKEYDIYDDTKKM